MSKKNRRNPQITIHSIILFLHCEYYSLSVAHLICDLRTLVCCLALHTCTIPRTLKLLKGREINSQIFADTQTTATVIARAHGQKTGFFRLILGKCGPEYSVQISSSPALGYSGLLATKNLKS